MTTKVLPGLTDEVKVPAFANLIDSVVPFTAVFKRPKTKKESKAIGKYFTDLSRKRLDLQKDYFEATQELEKQFEEPEADEEAITAKLDALEVKLEDDRNKLNDKGEAYIAKQFIRFEDLKDGNDKDIKCDKKWKEAILEAPGYEGAIGRALSYVWTGNKGENYEQGYEAKN